jgi:hypothetical protein
MKAVDLKKRYTEDIKKWNWVKIKEGAMNNLQIRSDEDGVEGLDYLGSVLQMYPSGKIYAPWTTNQTTFDVVKDQTFKECLDAVAEKHGLYITAGEGSSDDVFAGLWFDWGELETKLNDEPESISFFDSENEEKAIKLLTEHKG